MPSKTEVAQDLKDFLALNTVGVLCTWSKKHPQYPFGSVVLYDLDAEGRMVIFVSNISEHYLNLSANPKSCLYVSETFAQLDPQAFMRLSVLGDFKAVDESERETIQVSYFKRFPEAVDRSIAHSFVFFRSEPKEIRWIGGFGMMGWISGEKLSAARLDPVAYNGDAILSHMNADHQTALIDFVGAFSTVNPRGKNLLMASANSRMFSILVTGNGKHERIHIPLKRPVNSTDEFRQVLIEMLKECRRDQTINMPNKT